MTEPAPAAPPPSGTRPDTTMPHLVYALYAAALVNGLTALVGVAVAHVKRAEAAGTWLASHYDWQIRTFWWTLLFMAVGAVTIYVLVGFPIMFAAGVWFLYRVVKGWVRLGSARPIENPTAWL